MTIELFGISLFSTLFFTRVFAGWFHDRNGKNLFDDRSKTLTGMIRRITKKDIHHFHLGIIALLLALTSFFFVGVTGFVVFSLGVSISLVTDDLMLFLRKELSYPSEKYFERRNLMESIFLHIIILIVAILIF